MSDQNDFPWSITSPETIIITDTIMNDGRFMIYKLVQEVLHEYANRGKNYFPKRSASSSDHESHGSIVLWLNGTSRSEEQIRMGIQQLHNGSSGSSANTFINHRHRFIDPTTITSQVKMISIPIMISQSILISSSHQHSVSSSTTTNANDDTNNSNWDIEHFVKYELYQLVRSWMLSFQQSIDVVASTDDINKTRTSTNTASNKNLSNKNNVLIPWIIIEDVSLISNLLGERLTYAFIHSMKCLANRMKIPFGFMMRYSSDFVYDNVISHSIYHSYDWIGAGHHPNDDGDHGQRQLPWEHTLTEYATLMIDVVPLLSGYSREVHGRLICTRMGYIDCYNMDDDNYNNQHTIDGNATKTTTRKTILASTIPQMAITSIFNYCLHDDHVVTYRIK